MNYRVFSLAISFISFSKAAGFLACTKSMTLTVVYSSDQTQLGPQEEPPSGTILDLCDSNFNDLFHSDIPLLIDVYAPWCGPCKLLSPIIQECAADWKDSLRVSKFDVEGPPEHINQVKTDLLLRGMMPQKLPTLILVQNGQATQIHSGLLTKDELNKTLEKHLTTGDAVNGFSGTIKSTADEFEQIGHQKQAGFISLASSEANEYMLVDA